MIQHGDINDTLKKLNLWLSYANLFYLNKRMTDNLQIHNLFIFDVTKGVIPPGSWSSWSCFLNYEYALESRDICSESAWRCPLVLLAMGGQGIGTLEPSMLR